jgi:hypothetical protein
VLDLKLAKLPDRTPAKLTITLSAELNQVLREYTEAYQTSYGASESAAELISFMLATFIESDSRFKKLRRDRQSQSPKIGARASHQTTASGS